MVSVRAPSVAFDQLDAQGHRLWPEGLDRAALDPYYDLAERMLHVSQNPLAEVPKTGLVFAQLMKNLGYSVDRARYAVRGCQGSGFCVTGCVYGAKQSLFLNYLPQAVEAGAEIETHLAAPPVHPPAHPHPPTPPPRSGKPHPPQGIRPRPTRARGRPRSRARVLV